MGLMTALAVGGSLLGASMQSRAAGDAADAQTDSANAQIASNERIFGIQNQNFAPYREAGGNALQALMYERGLGDQPTGYQGYMATPGTQYAMQQAQRGIDGSAAAQGSLFSSATLDRQQQNAYGIAQSGYNDYINGLSGIAGMGQSSAAMQATAAGNLGTANSNALANMGNAQSAGIIGQSNAWNTGIGNAFQGWGMMQQLNGGGSGGTNSLFGGGSWS